MADEQKQLRIDVTNETAYKVGVVQMLQLLDDRTACLAEMKKKVDRHETIVQVGKWASIPILGLFNLAIKSILHKLGWG
ncbi:MAG TPA: hypothetical protein VFA52_03985 [Candidatus Paceibacterota bacterium]|jgi:hypothetical protein|nr:hypothetical protein [Candidatus Paceibacterota bacterium]